MAVFIFPGYKHVRRFLPYHLLCPSANSVIITLEKKDMSLICVQNFTTIKAITGVIRPTEGTIMINGIDVVKEALSINTYIRIEKGPGYPGLQLSPAGLITES